MPRQRPQALRSSVFQMREFWLYMTIALVVMILMDLNFVDFPTGEGGRPGSCSVSGSSCWTRETNCALVSLVDLVISGWWFQSFLYFHLFHPKLLHNTAHIPDISQVGLLFRNGTTTLSTARETPRGGQSGRLEIAEPAAVCDDLCGLVTWTVTAAEVEEYSGWWEKHGKTPCVRSKWHGLEGGSWLTSGWNGLFSEKPVWIRVERWYIFHTRTI